MIVVYSPKDGEENIYVAVILQPGPPPKKKKEESAEPKIRIRAWQPQWKKDAEGKPREWLVFDSEKNEMHCADCRRFRPSAREPFITGTNTFKLESVKFHEISPKHQWAETCRKNQTIAKERPAATPVARTLATLTEAQRDRVSKLIRTAHFLAKEGLAFTKVKTLCT